MNASKRFSVLNNMTKYPNGKDFSSFSEGAVKFSLPDFSKKEYLSVCECLGDLDGLFGRMPYDKMIISFCFYGDNGFVSIKVNEQRNSAEMMFAGSLSGIDYYAITGKIALTYNPMNKDQIDCSGQTSGNNFVDAKTMEMAKLSVVYLRILDFFLSFRESKVLKQTYKRKTKNSTKGVYSAATADDSFHVVKIGDMSAQEFIGELSHPMKNNGGVRSHFRRGHIRRLADGRNTWVRNSFVHGSKEGFVDKEYLVCA